MTVFTSEGGKNALQLFHFGFRDGQVTGEEIESLDETTARVRSSSSPDWHGHCNYAADEWKRAITSPALAVEWQQTNGCRLAFFGGGAAVSKRTYVNYSIESQSIKAAYLIKRLEDLVLKHQKRAAVSFSSI
jgi:hypothetical protein